MDAAWELGINTFDTADAYGGGRSGARDRQVDEVPRLRPEARLQDLPSDGGREKITDLRPARIRRQLESSLERLGVDRLDLYLTHSPDARRRSKTQSTASTASSATARSGHTAATRLDAYLIRAAAGRFGWIQNSYSLLDQRDEDEVLPIVEEHSGLYAVLPACRRVADREISRRNHHRRHRA